MTNTSVKREQDLPMAISALLAIRVGSASFYLSGLHAARGLIPVDDFVRARGRELAEVVS